MLINFLVRFFKKYIYTPHVHDWKYETDKINTTTVCDMTASCTVYIFSCKCGKLRVIQKEGVK